MLSRKQNSVHFYPESVTFGFHTAEDIRKISVVQITNPESFNALGHPTTGGLYDKLMGPADRKDGFCGTCHLQVSHCPGHYGHIELPLPCFHPLFLRNVANIMKLTCPVCKCFFASGEFLFSNFRILVFCYYYIFIFREEENGVGSSAGIAAVWLDH